MTPRDRANLPHDDLDDRTPEALRRAVLDHLRYTCGKPANSATHDDLYRAMAHAMRDRLLSRWLRSRATYRQADCKRIYYLSAEYLLGRALSQNLLNLGIYELAERSLAAQGVELRDVLDQEPDPGLGNGGLGRLAACFLDSMAALGLPGFGYGIRYEYGIFEQYFENGEQKERGDPWLNRGNPWEIPRYELTVPVRFYGRVEEHEENGRILRRWIGGKQVLGVPYDTPIAGYQNGTVNTLRLWSARAADEFDLTLFNAGDYRRAVEEKVYSETISRVLYPADHSPEGKELRLKQQYFFVACSIADIMRRYKETHSTLDQFPEKAAIQLNDTHPAVAVPELMRVLLDDERLEWNEAWRLTQASFGYTNHTLMPEALEKWPLTMFDRLLPRHLQIIYEINERLLREVHIRWPNDSARKRRVSIIEEEPERAVRMAHLAATGSRRINGVAAIHSELVRTRLLPEFAELYPERFVNQTNGVSPRRWLLVANPELVSVIDRHIGADWHGDLTRLAALAEHAEDAELHGALAGVKRRNKERLAVLIRDRQGISVNPDSAFVVQVKRIHEYKRQILSCLHIIALYRRLKEDPTADVLPQTFVFAGKAAPGYTAAKNHIRLIHDVAAIVNDDPTIDNKLRVVFLANYGVSLAERIIPAADVSLQISLAGTEASGTGNMKLSLNGALTAGTLDGANIEIREAVGSENFFLFGLTEDAVQTLRRQGYRPTDSIRKSEELRGVLELLRSGFFSPQAPGRTGSLADYLEHADPFMACVDFDAYVRCMGEVADTYRSPRIWHTKVVQNIAHMGPFSSDETIRRYARDIWQASPISVRVREP